MRSIIGFQYPLFIVPMLKEFPECRLAFTSKKSQKLKTLSQSWSGEEIRWFTLKSWSRSKKVSLTILQRRRALRVNHLILAGNPAWKKLKRRRQVRRNHEVQGYGRVMWKKQ
jgi:hypothetical protein